METYTLVLRGIQANENVVTILYIFLFEQAALNPPEKITSLPISAKDIAENPSL